MNTYCVDEGNIEVHDMVWTTEHPLKKAFYFDLTDSFPHGATLPLSGEICNDLNFPQYCNTSKIPTILKFKTHLSFVDICSQLEVEFYFTLHPEQLETLCRKHNSSVGIIGC